LDDLLVGGDTPSVPIEPRENPFLRGCGPTRAQLRGPFAGPDELTSVTLRDLVRKLDRAFATQLEAAFRNANAGGRAYAFATRGRYVLLASSGQGFTALATTKPIALASRVRYVA